MLDFKPIKFEDAEALKKYYTNCNYGASEYSVGTQLMWGIKHKTLWAEVHGCLICKDIFNRKTFFDYPVPLSGEDANIDKALDEIDAWCLENEIIPSFFSVPKEGYAKLFARYKYYKVRSIRSWSDYLYDVHDLAGFGGRKYSGQRNHINKFIKLVPDYEFKVLTGDDKELVEKFLEEYSKVFTKYDNPFARDELYYAKTLLSELSKDWCRCGGIYSPSLGKLLSFTLTEKCGKTLIIHIEKGLYEYNGIYPTTVSECAKKFGSDCEIINREEDANDKGLRTSKLQYLPKEIGSKFAIEVETELSVNVDEIIPTINTQRLTLDAFTDEDAAEYLELCSDTELNKYWGYDDLGHIDSNDKARALIRVTKDDFHKKIAINFAVRLNGKLIGEAVLHNFNSKGSAEAGCRIKGEFAGNGYGQEAFKAICEWGLYTAMLDTVNAKCFKQNEASYKMLKDSMVEIGSDDTYIYFVRKV